MYFRTTQIKKKTKSGDHYYTYRIVESQRIGKKLTQHTPLNLEVDLFFPEEQWPILTKRIKERVYGQRSFFNRL